MKCLNNGALWLLLMLMAGCSSTQTMEGIMSSWVDADIRDVEAQWGAPDEVRERNGNQIYVWNHLTVVETPKIVVRTSHTSRHTGSTSTTTAGGNAKYENCQRRLEVSAQGKVINWQWSGDRCPYREEGPYANWRRQAIVNNPAPKGSP